MTPDSPPVDTMLLDPNPEGGRMTRPASRFRDWISQDGSTPFPAEPGRYHLYVSYACPWAHRTLIARRLNGLEQAIGVSVVDPVRDERSWRFSGDPFIDRAGDMEFLSEAYIHSNPDYVGRFSVPVLWDRESATIVNNESADIMRMFSTAMGSLATPTSQLVPADLREPIDTLNGQIYADVNNAVYEVGFSRRQDAYEEAMDRLFGALDSLDERLASSRFLFSDAPVESDWRLFVTLVRFDAVYAIHFKCSRRRIVDYDHLWPYLRDLYQYPGIADTVHLDQIRVHYYATHPFLNPSGIVADQPQFDLTAPARRG